jgi:hypothetical protein
LAASDAIDVVELMAAELDIHPQNGVRLLERGWVTLGGERILNRLIDPHAVNGQFLVVLGRQLRVQAPAKHVPPQGELF